MSDTVVIVPYDTQWPALFSQLGSALRATLGTVAQRIDHIGSTAVSGLDAKPIIDLQISVVTFDVLASYRMPLEQLGYVYRADNEDRTKRYFREPPGYRRTHIHVRRSGTWAEQGALLFRDYLRAHPNDAQQYALLKQRLAERHYNARHHYSAAKTPFIWAMLQKAGDWSQATGWEPGPTDQ